MRYTLVLKQGLSPDVPLSGSTDKNLGMNWEEKDEEVWVAEDGMVDLTRICFVSPGIS